MDISSGDLRVKELLTAAADLEGFEIDKPDRIVIQLVGGEQWMVSVSDLFGERTGKTMIVPEDAAGDIPSSVPFGPSSVQGGS